MRMRMKMAPVSTISLLLLCCSAVSSAGSKEACNFYAVTGGNFTVPMVAALDQQDTLKWKHNDTPILHWKNQESFVVGGKESISENGSLKLTGVKQSDAGSYVPEVYDVKGTKKGTFEVMQLCVMDGAPRPSVSITCDAPSAAVTFTCRVQPKADGLRFAWFQNNQVLEKKKDQTLMISVDLVKADPISCKVSNLASSVTSAPVTHTCIVNQFNFPDEIFGVNTWILVAVGGGVVLVLIVVVIVCCACTKRRKRSRLKEEEELRLAWTNDQQKQSQPSYEHPHHQQHPQPQPAGHTRPRQQRHRERRDQQRPRAPDHDHDHDHANAKARAQPSPRRPAQAQGPPDKIDEEQPPPLPQPRKNAVKIQRV
ncbi:T-cell surface antigen CD2 [Liparis tanakae]|uniref:T-cell surface antigen CD2 n=1 Tax=Liparis tanakae TaxID=230148 RepID=A0A4Z2HX54_9TELE|nr:T-cell surface antigen CD2 [Liparis tanakae]